MRILTWNIRHGGGARAASIAERVANLAPDIAVLTEYRSNAAGELILDSLRGSGFLFAITNGAPPRTNSVAIVAREPISAQPVAGLGADSHRAIRARVADLELVALYFGLDKQKIPLFEALSELSSDMLAQDSLLIGDFNTGHHFVDEAGSTFVASDRLKHLETQGWIDVWRSRNPDAREFSWYSTAGNGFRLDHALASPSLNSKISNVRYSHDERLEGLSDHSVLLLELGRAVA